MNPEKAAYVIRRMGNAKKALNEVEEVLIETTLVFME